MVKKIEKGGFICRVSKEVHRQERVKTEEEQHGTSNRTNKPYAPNR